MSDQRTTLKNRAIFLDRDGVLNVDHGYVYEPEKLTYTEGVFEALQELQKRGYALIVVTNQSGIARGYYTESDVIRLHKLSFISMTWSIP